MDGTHRTKKRTAAILLGFFAAATIAMPSAQAADRTVSELIPVGQTVGVKLFSDGVLVVGFSDGESPAKDCGLKEGDVITAINGHKVENMGQLQEQISKLSPGDKVEVTYMREKKERKATVTLRNVQGTTSKVEAVDSDMMGAALRPLTDAEKKELNLRYGLVVSAIRSGKMKDAGITKGTIIMQVNDREMRTTEDFDEAVKSANLSTDRVLWIRAKSQSGLNRSYTIELTQPKDSKKK